MKNTLYYKAKQIRLAKLRFCKAFGKALKIYDLLNFLNKKGNELENRKA